MNLKLVKHFNTTERAHVLSFLSNKPSSNDRHEDQQKTDLSADKLKFNNH